MLKGTRKTPEDYPSFTFRCSEDEKTQINELIEEVREALNKRLPKNQKLWLKNDVIVEGLRLGLPILKKSGRHR